MTCKLFYAILTEMRTRNRMYTRILATLILEHFEQIKPCLVHMSLTLEKEHHGDILSVTRKIIENDGYDCLVHSFQSRLDES